MEESIAESVVESVEESIGESVDYYEESDFEDDYEKDRFEEDGDITEEAVIAEKPPSAELLAGEELRDEASAYSDDFVAEDGEDVSEGLFQKTPTETQLMPESVQQENMVLRARLTRIRKRDVKILSRKSERACERRRQHMEAMQELQKARDVAEIKLSAAQAELAAARASEKAARLEAKRADKSARDLENALREGMSAVTKTQAQAAKQAAETARNIESAASNRHDEAMQLVKQFSEQSHAAEEKAIVRSNQMEERVDALAERARIAELNAAETARLAKESDVTNRQLIESGLEAIARRDHRLFAQQAALAAAARTNGAAEERLGLKLEALQKQETDAARAAAEADRALRMRAAQLSAQRAGIEAERDRLLSTRLAAALEREKAEEIAREAAKRQEQASKEIEKTRVERALLEMQLVAVAQSGGHKQCIEQQSVMNENTKNFRGGSSNQKHNECGVRRAAQLLTRSLSKNRFSIFIDDENPALDDEEEEEDRCMEEEGKSKECESDVETNSTNFQGGRPCNDPPDNPWETDKFQMMLNFKSKKTSPGLW